MNLNYNSNAHIQIRCIVYVCPLISLGLMYTYLQTLSFIQILSYLNSRLYYRFVLLRTRNQSKRIPNCDILK